MQWWDALTLVCSVVTVIITMLQWRRSEALQPQRETNMHVQSINHEEISTEYKEGIIQLRPQGKYSMELVNMSIVSGALPMTNKDCDPNPRYIDRTTEPASIRFAQLNGKPAVFLIQWRRETFFGRHMIAEGMRVTVDLSTAPQIIQLENWNWFSPACVIRLSKKLHMNWFRPGYWKTQGQPWPKSSLPENVGNYTNRHKRKPL